MKTKSKLKRARRPAAKRPRFNQCANCYDGKLLMAGESCGVCGNAEPAKPLPKPERKCVYCGCTEGRACAGGCSWSVLHPKTLTGVCSQCVDRLPGIVLGLISITPPRDGLVWLQVVKGNHAGEGLQMKAKELIAVVEKLYRKHF